MSWMWNGYGFCSNLASSREPPASHDHFNHCLRPREGGLRRGENFCLRLTTANADSVRLWWGLRLGEIFGSALLQPARSVCVSLSAFYAALLPRRGPHIASHSVCPSLCLSVCPSVRPSVRPVIITERHVAPPSELQ